MSAEGSSTARFSLKDYNASQHDEFVNVLTSQLAETHGWNASDILVVDAKPGTFPLKLAKSNEKEACVIS